MYLILFLSQDGQSWLAKNGDIVDILVDKATMSNSLPSLAILRNLSFSSSGRSKLLMKNSFMTLMSQCLVHGHGTKLRLCLTSLWSLAANCHKAKVVLARQGIPQQLENLQNCENIDAEDRSLLSTTLFAVSL